MFLVIGFIVIESFLTGQNLLFSAYIIFKNLSSRRFSGVLPIKNSFFLVKYLVTIDFLQACLFKYNFIVYPDAQVRNLKLLYLWSFPIFIFSTLAIDIWLCNSILPLIFYLFVYFIFFLFFSFIFISWRLITLQYCSGFCHTLTWISHGFTRVPHPEPPSHLPPHPIPLGHPSAPALSACLMHPTWTGDVFHTW